MRRKDTHPRDRLDLSPKLLLDPVESEPVVVGNEVDGNTEVTKSATFQLELKVIHCHLISPSTAANPVQVGLSHLGEVEVDDDVDSLNVDTSGEEIAAHEVPAEAGPEVVEDSVAVSLGHLGVNVVAGVTELSDLLGQQLHSLG